MASLSMQPARIPETRPASTQKSPHHREDAGFFPFSSAARLCARDGRLHSLLVHQDALVLLVLVHTPAQKDTERLRTALLQPLVARLIQVLGNLLRGGLLLVNNLRHH